MLSQIERLSIEQKRLTKVLEQQQENWVKLFEEATQQFRLQGLYIPPSQVSKIISHNQFSLANQPVGEPAMKVMELRYNPEYLVDSNLVSYSLKKNSLIGLDPITKDDDQYVSADLAEQSAKPLQDDLSRQEVIQKEVDQEKEYIDRVEDQIIQGQIQKQEDQMEEKNIKSMLKIEETEALMLSRYLKSIKSDTVASFQGKLLYHADQILEKKNTWFENNQIQIETQFDVEPILPVAKQDARDELELIGEYDYATEDAILLEQQIIGEDQEISESELEFDLLQQQNLAKISNETRDTIPDLAGRPITFNDEQVFTPNPDFISKSPYGPKNLSEVDRWSRREFETALSNEQKLLTATPSQNEIRENQMAIDKINQKFETELMKAREDLEHSGEKISSLLKEE